MARKTNEEIRNMPIEDLEIYALEHPAESGRIATQLAKSSALCAKIQLQYTANKMFTPNPAAVTITL